MNILVLGGTCAMGIPLVQLLSQRSTVYVTTRRNNPPRIADNNVKFIIGNAKEMAFLETVLLQRHWDVIVDFMIWSKEFSKVVKLMLDSTDQYIFISSARVYAQTDELITEKTPRLLDVSDDTDYLKTNEYALAKAREENLLFKSGRNNFTIIRPTITYNDYRLQLGVLEKENWLYRALHGRSIVFSNDIATKLTTMTFVNDVATGIAAIVGNKSACGEAFHITCNQSLLWREVLEIYISEIAAKLGYRPRVVMTQKSTNLFFPSKKYQVIYCRCFNRSFDNKKISYYCDPASFKEPDTGLRECIRHFLSEPRFGRIDWALEAVNDRASGERTPLSEIHSFVDKLNYIAYRYSLKFILLPIKVAGKALNSVSKLRKKHHLLQSVSHILSEKNKQ